MTGACFRCGQLGHLARACPNTDYHTQFAQGSSASVVQPMQLMPPQYRAPMYAPPRQTQFVGQQGRGSVERPSGRGFVQPSTSQQAGRGQARVFTLTPQDAQASNAVVSGILSVCSLDARVLFDPGASHFFCFACFCFEDGVATIQNVVSIVCNDSTK